MKRAISTVLASVIFMVTVMNGYVRFVHASTFNAPAEPAGFVDESRSINEELVENALLDGSEADEYSLMDAEIVKTNGPENSTVSSGFSFHYTDAEGERIRVHGTAPQNTTVKFYKGEDYLCSLTADNRGIFQGYITIPGKQSGTVYVLRAVYSYDGATYERDGYVKINENAPVVTGLKYYDSVNSDENIDLYEKMTEGEDIWVGYFGNDDPFRFEILFTNPGSVSNAAVIAIKDGVRYKLDAVYDETVGGFVAEGFFDGTNKKFAPDSISVEYSASSQPDRTVTELIDVGEGSEIYDMVSEQTAQMQVEKTIYDENGGQVVEVICSYLDTTPEEGIQTSVKYLIKGIDYLTGMEMYDQYSTITGHLSYIVKGIDDKKYLVNVNLKDESEVKLLLLESTGELSGQAYEITLSCFNAEETAELPVKWIDFADSLDDMSTVLGTLGSLYKISMETDELKEDIQNSTYLSEENKQLGLEMADELDSDKKLLKVFLATLPKMVALGGMAAPVTALTTIIGGMALVTDAIYEKRLDMERAALVSVDWNKNFGSYQLTTADNIICQVDYTFRRQDYTRYSSSMIPVPIKDYRFLFKYDVTVSGNGIFDDRIISDVEESIFDEMSALYEGHLYANRYCPDSNRVERLNMTDGITGVLFYARYPYDKIIIPDSLREINTRPAGAFKTAGPGESYDICINWRDTIPSGCLTEFEELESVTLPSTIKRIEGNSLIFEKVEMLDIPASVEYVGGCAIGGDELKSVVFHSDFDCDGPVIGGGQYLTSAGVGGGCAIQFCWTDTIPDRLLYGLADLKTIVIPESVNIIGKYAFANCTSLENLVISERDSIKIDEKAFENCSSLTRLAVYADEFKFEQDSFKGCNNIAKLVLPENINCFYYSSDYGTDDEIIYKERYEAYYASSGSFHSFRSNIKTAGPLNDDSDYDLMFILDDKVPSYYFAGYDALENVTLPDTIESIEYHAFYGTEALEQLYLPESLTYIDGWVFDESGIRSINIPDSVTELGYGAFAESALESIRLSSSITEIPDVPSFYGGVVGVFEGCNNLKSISIPEGVTVIGRNAFKDSGIETIVLPSSLEYIGESAFRNTGIQSIDLPDNISEIGYSAFEATELTTIDLPENLETLGYYAFSDTPLQEAVMNSNFTINYGAFPDDTVLTIGKGMSKIPDRLFMDNLNIKTFKVPEHIESIGKEAFSGCSNLTNIELHEGLIEIGESAFASSGITSVNVPNTVERIGADAFSNCSSLTYASLGENVQTIGEHIFAGSGLDQLDYNTVHLSEIEGEKNIFNNISSDGLNIVIGEKVEYIPGNLFCYSFINVPGWTGLGIIKTIDFRGNQPEFGSPAFVAPKFTAYYPADDSTWKNKPTFGSEDEITWICKDKEFYGEHELVKIERVEPACEDDGNIEYYHCEICGKLFEDEDGKIEITDVSDVIIPATGHSWGEASYEWTEDYRYVTASVTCMHDPSHVFTEVAETTCDADPSICTEGGIVTYEAYFSDPLFETQSLDVEVLAEGHKTEMIPAVSATCTEPGLTEGQKCSVCGEILLAQEEIPALGHDYVNGICTRCGDALHNDGWEKDANGIWHYYTDGIAATGWKKVGSTWYLFNNEGDMLTGWQKVSGTWYYFTSSGAMVTGWQSIGGTWYYFTSGGAMVTGWQQISGTWYYFTSGGAMVTGWQQVGGKWYYFKSSGAMAANEWCGGYWLNADGSWTYQPKGSWKQDSTGWWFGDTSGWYAKNSTVKIDGVNYKFNASGYWVK